MIVNFAYKCGAGRTQVLEAGTGERAARLERARLPETGLRGSRGAGGWGRGGGSPVLQLSPGKSPARRERRAAPRAGRGRREQRRPEAGCSHGKTHRAPGWGRRAPGRLTALGGRPGRGCSRPPPGSAPRGAKKSLAGRGRWSPGPGTRSSHVPDAAHRVLSAARGGRPRLVHAGHTRRCTRPPGWRGEASTSGAGTDPGADADACSKLRPAATGSCTHMITCTHVRPHTRASLRAEGRKRLD